MKPTSNIPPRLSYLGVLVQMQNLIDDPKTSARDREKMRRDLARNLRDQGVPKEQQQAFMQEQQRNQETVQIEEMNFAQRLRELTMHLIDRVSEQLGATVSMRYERTSSGVRIRISWPTSEPPYSFMCEVEDKELTASGAELPAKSLRDWVEAAIGFDNQGRI